MGLSRRDFLKLGGLTAVTATASACGVAGRQAAQRSLPQTLAASLPPAAGGVDVAWRLLNRAGFGPRPGEATAVRQSGVEAYLESQLRPEQIDDTAADLIVRNAHLYQLDIDQLLGQEPREAARELIWLTTARALYSKRQLYEAMVSFWSDHFNIYLGKNRLMPLLKLVDDREVIRPYALGKFRDLLAASLRSPAMLTYLDNVRNQKDAPNENYARELLELHTLGVDGGYTQQDVQELARILTGWRVGRRGRSAGKFLFEPAQHDQEEKMLLGRRISGGDGEAEMAQVVDLLAGHPSTAVFLATKLVRRFVADAPSAALVTAAAETYRATDGEIGAMLRVIFLSDAFAAAPPKLKRPFTFMISALRALNTDVAPRPALADWLRRLGQPPFQWPAPDGYPVGADAWATNLLTRWNFALALTHNRIEGARPPLAQLVERAEAQDAAGVVDLFAGLTWGRALPPETAALFGDYVGNGRLADSETRIRLRDVVALLLASPAFQWT